MADFNRNQVSGFNIEISSAPSNFTANDLLRMSIWMVAERALGNEGGWKPPSLIY
jgi:hypothetical protein